MARITVEDCIEKIPNRFELVLVATKRARQIAHGIAAAHPAREGQAHGHRATRDRRRQGGQDHHGRDAAIRSCRRRGAGGVSPRRHLTMQSSPRPAADTSYRTSARHRYPHNTEARRASSAPIASDR